MRRESANATGVYGCQNILSVKGVQLHQLLQGGADMSFIINVAQFIIGIALLILFGFWWWSFWHGISSFFQRRDSGETLAPMGHVIWFVSVFILFPLGVSALGAMI